MSVQIDEAGDHGNRHVALRIARFLGRRRDGVESDVGKKDDGGRARDAAKAVRRKRRPVIGLHVERSDDDEKADDAQLQDDHRRVQPGALANSAHEHPRDAHHDQERRQVEHDREAADLRGLGDGPRPAQRDDAERLNVHAPGLGLGHLPGGLCGAAVVDAEPLRQRETEAAEELLEIGRPRDGHGHVAHGVLQDEIPADDPRRQLSERGVRIGVGRARYRHHGSELGIAQRGESAGHRHEHERHDERGSGAEVRGAAGGRRPHRREDAGANHRADAHRRELHRAKGPAQPLLWSFGLLHQPIERLDAQRVHDWPRHSTLSGELERRRAGRPLAFSP